MGQSHRIDYDMNARERFRRLTRGEPADRMFYLEEPIRKEVLERWCAEGLSRRVTAEDYRDFFGLDCYAYLHLPLQPSRGELRSAGEFRRLEKHYRTHRADCFPVRPDHLTVDV